MTMQTLSVEHVAAHVTDLERLGALLRATTPEITVLSVAENVLLFNNLHDDIFNTLDLAVEDAKYFAHPYGNDDFRERAAAFLSRSVGDAGLKAGEIFAVSGVSAALECLAFSLFKPGDEVLSPAPCWQGFKWCFEQRPGMVLRTFAPPAVPGADPFALTFEAVERACKENPKAKVLVLTNPNNPLGVNYSPDLLEKIYSFVLTDKEMKERGMHIISDEIYMHSQTGAPQPRFKSARALDAYQNASAEDKARVHVVWGFAKDFGLSGFKAGLILSSSPEVKAKLMGDSDKNIEPMAWFSPLDSLKSRYLLTLLEKDISDTDENVPPGSYARSLMDDYYPRSLTNQYKAVVGALDEYKLKFYHPPDGNAGLFIWLDLSEYLQYMPPPPALQEWSVEIAALIAALKTDDDLNDGFEKEVDLFNYMLHNNVKLLPGHTLSSPVPGYFRLCYTAYDKDRMVGAIGTLARALNALKPER
jgi:aspartate/methionine/tyrosine aminotransferase